MSTTYPETDQQYEFMRERGALTAKNSGEFLALSRGQRMRRVREVALEAIRESSAATGVPVRHLDDLHYADCPGPRPDDADRGTARL